MGIYKVGKLKKIIDNMKIRSKLLVIYLIVVAVTVITIGIYFTTRMTNIVVYNAKKEGQYNVSQIKERVYETLKMAITTSDMIYSDEKLHSIVKGEYKNYWDNVQAYNEYPVLSNYLKYYSNLENIRLYVDNETILDNSNIVKVTPNVVNSEWYKRARADKGIITWQYKYDEISKDYSLSLIRDISCGEDGHIGVLAININGSYLEKIALEQPYPVTILVDSVVVSSNDLKKGEKIDLNYNNKDVTYYSYVEEEFTTEDKYVISNRFKIDKSFNNIFEVIVNIPIDEITGQGKKVVNRSINIISVAIILSLMAILYFSKHFSNRINLLSKEMNKVVNGNFNIKETIGGSDEISDLYKNLHTMMKSIKELIEDSYVKELQKKQLMVKQKDAEFKMLASQINPHFLYNTLETIRMRAFCNGDKELAGIVKKLGKIMRRNLEVTNKVVSLEYELEFIKDYLEIQSLRFKGKIEYEFDIEVDIKKYKLLPLLLQPIVENAFVHGLEKITGNGKITISIFQDIGYLIVEISDNGIGIPPDKLEYINNKLSNSKLSDNNEGGKNSIGISNVYERIKILYGDEYGLYILSTVEVGTKVILLLPEMKGDTENYENINNG